MLRTCVSTGLLFLLIACGGGDDQPQELINKLRGLGMDFSPLVTPPSVGADQKTVTVTVYAAVPTGKAVTIEKYQDQVQGSTEIQLSQDQYEITKTEAPKAYQGISIVSFLATIKVPDASQLPAAGSFVYLGFLLKADSNQEKMVGSFLVLPTGAANWKKPLLSITAPNQGATLAVNEENPISLSMTDYNNEDLKIGWFVSGGQISNRRSQSTYWQNPTAGDYTLIATIRGLQSRAFVMAIRTVHFN